MKLSLQQQKRFARQIALPEVGAAGQKKIMAARVMLVGAGGLGSAAAFYLAAAGVGTIGIAEGDRVEASNLQRQILFSAGEIGRAKAECAAKRLLALNPQVKVNLYPKITSTNADVILKSYAFIIDATDNFSSKMLIAKACRQLNKPYAYAGITGFGGQAMTSLPGKTACLGCLYAGLQKPEEKKIGPLGIVPGILGVIQAAEAIKYVLGAGRLLTNRLLVVDILTMKFREIAVKRNKNCPFCGRGGK